MPKTLAEVTRDAAQLSAEEKFLLAGTLLESTDFTNERLYLLECVEICRHREAEHPDGADDITLDSFLREQAKTPKGA
jgi:hypothetical protein